MIEVQNIKKGFADKTVINDVSAKLDTGKCNLIIGASGSGKTVLMKCLVGLFEPDEGDIIYDDQNFTKMNTAERKVMRQQIGMLFQGSALFDSMTVEENVFFPLDMFSSLSYKDKRKRVQEVLDRVNLQGANKKFPSEISGGMKKRVGIARAIVLNPKYLFCDEPNSGLDPKTAILIDNLLREITEEYDITTVINTHDMNSVMEIGDKIVFLKDGLVAWEGTKKEVFKTDNEAIVDFVYSSDLFKKVREVYIKDDLV